MKVQWTAQKHMDAWALIPTILVGADYRSCTIGIAWLPFCAGVDITW